MRVAILALHFAEYAARLALALARDHDVLLILGSRNARDELSQGVLEQLDRSLDLCIAEVPRLRDPRVVPAVADLRRRLLAFRPDVVHIQEYHQLFTGPPILALRRRVPVIITVHDPLPHSGSLRSDGWRWRIVQWVRQLCARMIVHGSNNRRSLETSNRRVAGRVEVVPHGLLGSETIDEDIDCAEPPTFLFFGRVEPYKGLSYLLDACDLLARRGHRFRLVIAGRGSDLEQSRGRIESASWAELEERFIPTDELAGMFRQALAVVLPYTDATQSGVSAMAFAYSRPVIATDVGDVPEVVIDGESGLIVPPRDAQALAASMERLLGDRALRDRLAVGAGHTARERLSWPSIARQTEAVYQRALAAHPGAA